MSRSKVAIIGSGNIGTDLMIKVMRLSKVLEMGAFVGIDPESPGLQRAARLGVPTTARGIEGLVAMPEFPSISLVFDATSAGAHKHHDAVLRQHGKTVIDLTPAALGPYVIPPVNGAQHLALQDDVEDSGKTAVFLDRAQRKALIDAAWNWWWGACRTLCLRCGVSYGRRRGKASGRNEGILPTPEGGRPAQGVRGERATRACEGSVDQLGGCVGVGCENSSAGILQI